MINEITIKILGNIISEIKSIKTKYLGLFNEVIYFIKMLDSCKKFAKNWNINVRRIIIFISVVEGYDCIDKRKENKNINR